MHDLWHWLVVGFAFGIGFTLGQLVCTGVLSLIGRGHGTVKTP